MSNLEGVFDRTENDELQILTGSSWKLSLEKSRTTGEVSMLIKSTKAE